MSLVNLNLRIYQITNILLKTNRNRLYTHRINAVTACAATMLSTAVVNNAKINMPRQIKFVKKKLCAGVPGTVNLQVLGSGGNGAPTAVYIFTDQKRYIFNCGEGTQRLAHEHKTRLSRLDHVFVTRNTWRSLGGIPGLILTLQESGVEALNLHGPPALETIMYRMRHFVVLKTIQLNAIDCTEAPYYEDHILSVRAVPLYNEGVMAPNDDFPKVVMSYICELKPRPGALLLDKCVEQGVQPGPLLGRLKNGEDITLENGKIVRSKDVTEPAETGLCFVFIDIPSESFLPSLQKKENIFKELGSEVAVVVHFSGCNMLQNDSYQSFMKRNFVAQTKHMYLNDKTAFSGHAAAHRIQYQLNQLDSNIFPLLAEAKNIQSHTKEDLSNESGKNLPHKASAMSSFHMRPHHCFDKSLESKLTPTEWLEETHNMPGFLELLDQLKCAKSKLNTQSTPAYPIITFLGTGSCVPNKTRNVSSILVQTSADAYVLLDCGEGTYGQIIRFFGHEKTEQVLRQLRFIYVSHLHADHHIGLIGLLCELKKLKLQDKVVVLAPIQIEPWLNFYNESIEPINDSYTLVGNAELLETEYNDTENLSIAKIRTCLVRHCAHSYGVCITLNAQHEGKPISITYSGDTMPCADLVELGQNCTILIHEATMENDLVNEAQLKTHSTLSQAIEVGREMQAQHIILTHFSQRYAKCPRLDFKIDAETDITATPMNNIAIAFDNMQVRIGDLPHFHLLYPSLYTMFADYAEDLELKALKRELKEARKRKIEEVL